MKTSTSNLFRVLALSLAAIGLQSAPTTALAQAINLPTANCGTGLTNNCLQFDDFQVYSLGLLSYYQSTYGLYSESNFVAKSNDASLFVLNFNGQGTPAQGVNGQTSTNIDDPYDSLTGNPDIAENNLRFLMASQSLNSGSAANDIPSDPAGTGTWDNTIANHDTVVNSGTFTSLFDASKFDDSLDCKANINTEGCLPLWDAKITDLKAALAGAPLLGLFEFNEIGADGTLLGQDLTAWARITLTDSQSNATKEFTFSGNNVTAAFQSYGQINNESDILPTSDDLWARVHSQICISEDLGTAGQVYLGQCADSPFTKGYTLNQALGANQADFAIYNQELNDIIQSGGGIYDIITFDVRMAYLSDGGDRLWFGPGTVPRQVPEPGSLALIGLAALGLGALRRRSQKA